MLLIGIGKLYCASGDYIETSVVTSSGTTGITFEYVNSSEIYVVKNSTSGAAYIVYTDTYTATASVYHKALATDESDEVREDIRSHGMSIFTEDPYIDIKVAIKGWR